MGTCRSRYASVKCIEVDPHVTTSTVEESKKLEVLNKTVIIKKYIKPDGATASISDNSNNSRDVHESISAPKEAIPSPKNEINFSDLLKKQLVDNCSAIQQAVEHLIPSAISCNEYLKSKDNETIPFPKNGIKLSYLLNEFVEECGGRGALIGKTTEDFNKEFAKPLTKDYELSYCDMILEKAKKNDELDGIVQPATVFISHAWKYEFLHVLDALEDHFQDEPDKIVWFDIVSNNQHKATDLEYGWWATTFKDAIKQLGHTVMVMAPWNDPIPYKRAWCIFEAYCTNITGAKFEIAMSSKEQKAFIEQCKYDSTGPICQMLSDVDAEKSDAYNPDDKERIHTVIREEIGFAGLNSMLFEQLREWVIAVGLKELKLSEEDSEEQMAFMNMVGTLYRDQGKYDLAEPLYEESFSKHEKKLGSDHSSTLESMNNLATLYRIQGKYDLAEPLHKNCLSKREIILGPDHPDTLKCINSLATLYRIQGKYDVAEPLHKKCLSKREIILGPDHPDTLKCINSLAILYRNQGKYTLAETFYKDCLSKRETILGLDHPKTLKCMNSLAILYRNQGNYELAEKLLKKCLSKRETTLGSDHPDTLNTMHNLALLYFHQGNHELAEVLFKKCLSKRETIFGPDHAYTTQTRDGLSDVQRNIGECKI